MTVGELGRRMSSREFYEWSLYDRVQGAETEAAKAAAAARAERAR